MIKVISPKQAGIIAKNIKKLNKKIVLAGGCFDVLHDGHIKFLSNAKKQGDFLFVLLESDFNVEKYKGQNRPVNTQAARALTLSDLESVDYVIRLVKMTKDLDYDKLISQIKPDVIAATKGDREIRHKQRQAQETGAKVIYVVDRIKDLSTTKILENYKYAKNISK